MSTINILLCRKSKKTPKLSPFASWRHQNLPSVARTTHVSNNFLWSQRCSSRRSSIVVSFFFNFVRRKYRTGAGATIHRPFQTLNTVLQLRICGLEHVINGHAGDRFFDVLFSFFSHFFSEPHSYRSYQTQSYLLEQQFAWVTQIFWRKFRIKPSLLSMFVLNSNTWPFGMFHSPYPVINLPLGP